MELRSCPFDFWYQCVWTKRVICPVHKNNEACQLLSVAISHAVSCIIIHPLLVLDILGCSTTNCGRVQRRGRNTYAGLSVRKISTRHTPILLDFHPDTLKENPFHPCIPFTSFPRQLISWSASWGSSAPTRTLKKSPAEACCPRVECGRQCASTYRKRAVWVRCVFLSSTFPARLLPSTAQLSFSHGAWCLQVVVSLSDELLSQAVMMVESCRPTLTINLSGARQHWLEGMLRHEIGRINCVNSGLWIISKALACKHGYILHLNIKSTITWML